MHYEQHPQYRPGDRPVRYLPEEADHYRGAWAVGDRVRIDNRDLARIVGFAATWSHVHAGRIVLVEPIGPSYGISVAWESRLTAAECDDRFGVHPHFADCPCGLGYDGELGTWRHAPASWDVGGNWHVVTPHPQLTREVA